MSTEKTTKLAVKGGWISRGAKSGRFVSVESGSKISKSSAKTEKTLEDVKSRRKDALARLADR